MLNPDPSLTFHGLGIADSLLRQIDTAKLTTPTPIQKQSIPIAIEGKDVIGIAQTGTGKTLAFGIPMIQRLGRHKGRGLVLLPTRELPLQVNETLQRIGQPLGLRTSVLIGGESMHKQLQALSRRPHILVATPGRLIDHMKQGSVKLGDIKILVLDEADRMLDMGFAPQLNQILKAIPRQRQTMLFSATMPAEIVKIASQHMALPVRVEVAPAGTAAHTVEQELFIVKKDSKLSLLEKLLTEYSGTILLFSRTKHGAKKICRAILAMGHTAAEIHSNRSLAQRIKALDGFKSGTYRVLVATDIAARGIDVQNISLVINFDLPDDAGDYVHRIGRTGRAGRAGKAISFATPDQGRDIKDIERLMKKTLRATPLPTLPPPRILPPHPIQPGGAPSHRRGPSHPRQGHHPSSHPRQHGRPGSHRGPRRHSYTSSQA